MSAPHAQHDSSSAPRFRYTAALAGEIETRWQREWESRGTFVVSNPGDAGFEASRPKFYCLDMFPYPSGAGLHVGHPEGYTATDILCRYKRMKGFNVLHPMGWDAFGLPAEQYAIQTGVHPAQTTRKAIDNFRRQLQRFGFCYDWSREFATIDPEYYRWTQWIFLKLYNSWYDGAADRARPIEELIAEFKSKKRAFEVNPDAAEYSGAGASRPVLKAKSWDAADRAERHLVLSSWRLAYIAEVTVNWCPKLGTALANEEVIDGRSERGSFPVFRKPLRQWMLRITAYAERLLRDLDGLDWPTSTRTMQEEWIGRSEGAYIDFPAGNRRIRVFTTRPDTVYGATFMVLAPEHPLVDVLTPEKFGETIAGAWRGRFPGADELIARGASPKEMIAAYRAFAGAKSDVDRQADAKEKTGVFTGAYAINPMSGERVPVFIADYVLMGYGTGAIMAVPAHDDRDYEFARQFGVKIRDVVYPRHVLAMKYYGERATPQEAAGEKWFGMLADFLGLITSRGLQPADFEGALDLVRGNPRERETASTTDVAIEPGVVKQDVPGWIGERRGVTKLTWLDAIESIGFKSFDEMREWFRGGSFYEKTNGAFSGQGHAANSAEFTGMQTVEMKPAITARLEQIGHGKRRVNYRLRDWLFSRQRYWGEPFPIVYDEAGRHYAIHEKSLPLTLPELVDYTPEESDDPRPLLAKAKQWMHSTVSESGLRDQLADADPPPDAPVVRETNTMPGWAGSCWYYLRYASPKDGARFVGEAAEKYWMGRHGVDLYIGGAEHAVLHLLYARFWHKVLFDLGEVSVKEPFQKLFHQGLITSFAYQRADKTLVPTDMVEERGEGGGEFFEKATGEKLSPVIAKMSKSLKNVVNPDDVIAEFGADTFRLYEMYMGPLEASKPWNPRDISGLYRFLQRLWRVAIDEETGEVRAAAEPDAKLDRELHKLVHSVAQKIETLSFNTAIADLIKFVNDATGAGGAGGGALTRDQIARLALVLCPFAPHMAEELWSRVSPAESGLASAQAWPAHDPAMLVDAEIELPVQIAGKVRAKITVPKDADAAAVERAALADEKVKAAIEGKSVQKVIVVPGRMVNLVVK